MPCPRTSTRSRRCVHASSGSRQREVILDVQRPDQGLRIRRERSTTALNDINFEHASARVPLRRRSLGLRQVHAGPHPRRAWRSRARARSCCDGKPVSEPGSDRGMVFQGYTLFPWLTVKKNVMFGLEVNGAASTRPSGRRCNGWSSSGWRNSPNAYPHQLSGGMKQRVAIVRALANQPRILLMDEPFGALDAQTRCRMQAHLLEIWRKIDITIVFITHDLDEAIFLADRILVLSAHPGEVQELIEVPVPRPRNPAQFITPEFLATKARLEELIHKGAAMTRMRTKVLIKW